MHSYASVMHLYVPTCIDMSIHVHNTAPGQNIEARVWTKCEKSKVVFDTGAMCRLSILIQPHAATYTRQGWSKHKFAYNFPWSGPSEATIEQLLKGTASQPHDELVLWRQHALSLGDSPSCEFQQLLYKVQQLFYRKKYNFPHPVVGNI